MDEFFDNWCHFEDEVAEKMVSIDLLDFVDVDGIILRALISELSILEALSLTVVATFFIKSLVKRVLQETSFDFVDVDLIGCYVAD